MKKLNCKHGLERREEIQARRIKDVLIGKSEDKENAVKNRVTELYKAFCKNNDTNQKIFYYYISKKDPVLFSAIKRCMEIADFSEYMRVNNITLH